MTRTFLCGSFYANKRVCLDMDRFCSFDYWLYDPVSENWQLTLVGIELCNIYLSERGYYRGKSLCNPAIEFDLFSDSSDTSHSIYSRAAFMTVFVLYTKAIIRGWLL